MRWKASPQQWPKDTIREDNKHQVLNPHCKHSQQVYVDREGCQIVASWGHVWSFVSSRPEYSASFQSPSFVDGVEESSLKVTSVYIWFPILSVSKNEYRQVKCVGVIHQSITLIVQGAHLTADSNEKKRKKTWKNCMLNRKRNVI